MIDSLLLSATRVITCNDDVPQTNATGFFFERGRRLFLVTSRHVMLDVPSNHKPDGLQIELHVDVDNMTESTGFLDSAVRGGQERVATGSGCGRRDRRRSDRNRSFRATGNGGVSRLHAAAPAGRR